MNADKLLKSRGGPSHPNYSCPKHISVDACKALFDEIGATPEPKAVGVLGDILENFALELMEDFKGKPMALNDLQQSLRKKVGSQTS